MKNKILFSFLSIFMMTVWADVPVTDIPAKLSELKQSSQIIRYEFTADLVNGYQYTSDPLVIENLLSFEVGARALWKELKEPTWMYVMLDNLRLSMVLVKLKFVPLAVADMMALYKTLPVNTEAYRIQVPVQWISAVPSIDSSERLLELLNFTRLAKEYGETLAYKDHYITAQLESMAEKIAFQLARINPQMEGKYQVRLNNIPYYLMILRTGDELSGLAVSLNDISTLKIKTIFPYSKSPTVNEIHGEYFNDYSFDQIRLRFDRTNLTVMGYYRPTSNSDKFPLLDGICLSSPTTLFAGQLLSTVPYPLEKVEGVYEGFAEGGDANSVIKLIVKREGPDRFAATMLLPWINYANTDKNGMVFTSGYYLDKSRVLVLSANRNSHMLVHKAFVGFIVSATTGEITATALYYNVTEAAHLKVNLKRIGDVDPYEDFVNFKSTRR
ncbi:MAG: hypothetical protein WCG27_07160 [Pseudomonadota bacterium]